LYRLLGGSAGIKTGAYAFAITASHSRTVRPSASRMRMYHGSRYWFPDQLGLEKQQQLVSFGNDRPTGFEMS
jgi:hypothetical protein